MPGSSLPPIRSWLYAPGNNPRLLDKVFGAGSDAVILDLEDAEPHAGLQPGSVALVCNVESAAGVWRALEIGQASSRVQALAFGAADFVRDVAAQVGPDGEETLYARSRLVLAARVAGLGPPVDSADTR